MLYCSPNKRFGFKSRTKRIQLIEPSGIRSEYKRREKKQLTNAFYGNILVKEYPTAILSEESPLGANSVKASYEFTEYSFITTLGLSNAQAMVFLQFAAVIDFVVAIGVFIPVVSRWVFLYTLLWGLLTAAARLTTHVYFDHLFRLTLHQTLFEFLIRVPHFMLPLVGFLMTKKIVGRKIRHLERT